MEDVSSLYSQPPPYLVHYLLESPTLVVLGNPCLSSPSKFAFFAENPAFYDLLIVTHVTLNRTPGLWFYAVWFALAVDAAFAIPTQHSVIPNRIHPIQGYNVSIRLGQQRLLFQGLFWENAPSSSFCCVRQEVCYLFSFLSRLSSCFLRARELEVEERIGARYRPPALRALASGGSPPNESPSTTTPAGETSTLPPTSFPAGFRRARAGTLPSNVQLAAQRFAQASSNLSSAAQSTESFSDQLQQRQNLLSTNSSAAPVRPNLRHSATSVAAAAAVPAVLGERNSRLRSGSLTLPAAGLSNNAFGPSFFSSSTWLSNRANSGLPVLDDLHSVTSMESGADDFDVHTLDYLGLDDSMRNPPAATISELRTQAQQAIAGNLAAANPARVRANTVSNPYRLVSSAGPSVLSTPNPEEEDVYGRDLYHSQGLDVYDDGSSGGLLTAGYVAKGFKNADHLSAGLGSRPRAISVGNLDDPARLHRRIPGDIQPSPYGNDIASMGIGSGSLTPGGIMRSDKSRAGASVHFPSGELSSSRASPYLTAPATQGRAVSPKSSDGGATQMQTPTRSLWIGNLDSSVTSEQLIHVFAPYGAIESLRLLPEKVLIP